jgi:hypothetical protein
VARLLAMPHRLTLVPGDRSVCRCTADQRIWRPRRTRCGLFVFSVVGLADSSKIRANPAGSYIQERSTRHATNPFVAHVEHRTRPGAAPCAPTKPVGTPRRFPAAAARRWSRNSRRGPVLVRRVRRAVSTPVDPSVVVGTRVGHHHAARELGHVR